MRCEGAPAKVNLELSGDRPAPAKNALASSGLAGSTGGDALITTISAHFACTEGKHVVIQFFWYCSTGGFFNGNGYLRSQYDSPLVLGLLIQLK